MAHARNVKCANGGLTSEAVALLVWADTVERGRLTEACAFTQRASPDLPADLCRLTAVDQLFSSYQTAGALRDHRPGLSQFSLVHS